MILEAILLVLDERERQRRSQELGSRLRGGH
jgi:hypothetical protein